MVRADLELAGRAQMLALAELGAHTWCFRGWSLVESQKIIM